VSCIEGEIGDECAFAMAQCRYVSPGTDEAERPHLHKNPSSLPLKTSIQLGWFHADDMPAIPEMNLG
jgi:hypothetical protein